MDILTLRTAEILIWSVTVVFLALPVWWAWRMAWKYLFPTPAAPTPEADLPYAAIVLPLRGADPSLRDCLRGLLNLDYPRYTLRVVVDNAADPALAMVDSVLAAGHAPNVTVDVSILRKPCHTCTLKISAQLQALAELDEAIEVVALIDADALPPRNWLRTLVAPFADPRVGAVTGVRWYAPARPSWGTLVRHLWNAASQPQMIVFGHPWGGTLALPARLLRDNDLLKQWQHSLCDDSGLGELLARLGLELRTLPALTMVNDESVSLPDCVRFLRRQLLCPRVDMSNWPLILAANAASLLAFGTAATLAVSGLVLGHLPWLVWFGSALALYFVGLMGALVLVEWRIRHIVQARGQSIPPPAPAWRVLLAGLLTQGIQCYCLAAAACARRVRWRGVDYRIEGQGRLHLVQYRPLPQPLAQLDPERSIV